ncbi:hypothetical protein Purlil1_11629 [Purpureocillium lilacinum]|uniref:Uncharacterized protein n=1 Tax=Purpureocillium lilacinum TaxID=33203 RepID=A0ABR0BJB0_PURLI|nr:hypothetical protein Purlil1_11629 [Purpureocillium lilacinum]
MAAARRVEMDARRSGALDEESHLGMDQAKKKNKMEKRAKTKGHHATGGIGREQGGWGMDREGEAKNEWCGRREGDGHARQAGGDEREKGANRQSRQRPRRRASQTPDPAPSDPGALAAQQDEEAVGSRWTGWWMDGGGGPVAFQVDAGQRRLAGSIGRGGGGLDMVPKARMAWQLHGPPGIVPSPGSDSAAQGAANHHTTDATPRHRHERGTTRRDEAWTGRQAGRHPERMDGWMDGRPPRWLAQTGWHERQSKLRSESGADDSHSAGPFRTRRVHSAKGARADSRQKSSTRPVHAMPRLATQRNATQLPASRSPRAPLRRFSPNGPDSS